MLWGWSQAQYAGTARLRINHAHLLHGASLAIYVLFRPSADPNLIPFPPLTRALNPNPDPSFDPYHNSSRMFRGEGSRPSGGMDDGHVDDALPLAPAYVCRRRLDAHGH